MGDEPASIGQATMLEDRTVVLLLRAEDPDTGTLGDARFEYPPTHPDYDDLLAHLGGIEPGQDKPVPPWPSDGG
jgi:hypothetical protein